MGQVLLNRNYERLRNFYRINSLIDYFKLKNKTIKFEDETLHSIKENINNYKLKEQLRLKKIEKLTKILEKIEYKIKLGKY